MKHFLKKYAPIAILVLSTSLFTACDALLDSSYDSSDYYSSGAYYPVSYSGDWYPPYGYIPAFSPGYWNGPVHPGVALAPSRPGGNLPAAPSRPVGNVRPGQSSTPSGNIRPGQSSSSSSSSVVPAPGTWNPASVTGGQPGIVMPPEGSGLKPVEGRH